MKVIFLGHEQEIKKVFGSELIQKLVDLTILPSEMIVKLIEMF